MRARSAPTIKEQVAYYNAYYAEDRVLPERAYPNPWQLQRAVGILEAIAQTNRRRPAICQLGSVIEHVEEQARYVEVAYNLLKPGGRLILTSPNSHAVAAMPPQSQSHQPTNIS
jgi:hypothetical protein